MLVARLDGDSRSDAMNKDVMQGGLWLAGGLVVTALTYSSASGGGSYVVAWGAIIFGGIQFFRGLAQGPAPAPEEEEVAEPEAARVIRARRRRMRSRSSNECRHCGSTESRDKGEFSICQGCGRSS
jgi:hypothetical protein